MTAIERALRRDLKQAKAGTTAPAGSTSILSSPPVISVSLLGEIERVFVEDVFRGPRALPARAGDSLNLHDRGGSRRSHCASSAQTAAVFKNALRSADTLNTLAAHGAPSIGYANPAGSYLLPTPHFDSKSGSPLQATGLAFLSPGQWCPNPAPHSPPARPLPNNVRNCDAQSRSQKKCKPPPPSRAFIPLRECSN